MNARDHRKRTPLHVAAEGGEEELIALLLDNNADCHITDLDGNTPLDIAILQYARAAQEHERVAKQPVHVRVIKEHILDMIKFFRMHLFLPKKDAVEELKLCEDNERCRLAFNLLLKKSMVSSSKKDIAMKKALQPAMDSGRVKDNLVRGKIREMSPFRYGQG